MPRVRTSIFAVVLFAASAVHAGLIVLQVEAPELNTGLYAPLNFTRKPTTTGTDTFTGKRFFALSGTTTTGIDRGVHAADVGNAFYGASAPGSSAISDIYVQTSSDFLSRVLLPTRRGRFLPPTRIPGRAKIVNASFSGSTGRLDTDARLLRAADILVSRDSAVLVAGAVTSSTGAFENATLIWGARNVLAVRGDAIESIFQPSASTPGRAHADLWDYGTASVATANVSSIVAAVISDADSRNNKFAATPPAVRATLMTSARRVDITTSGQRWSANLANGLNATMGAGRASLSDALELSRAAPVRTNSVSGWSATRGGTLRRLLRPDQPETTLPVARSSLSSLRLAPRAVIALAFRLTESLRGVAAALAWDTSTSNGAIGDLRLELRTITLTPKGDAILAEQPLLFSDAPSENIRFLTADQTFAPGLYAWVIRNESSQSARPALSWTFGASFPEPPQSFLPANPQDLPPPSFLPSSHFGGSSIPEPTTLAAVSVLVPLLSRRRRPSPTPGAA